MGKAKRERKKEKVNKAELEAARKRTEGLRRIVLAGILVLTGAAAAVSYWVFDEPRLAGASLLAGALIWLMVALGFLGSAVRPRDRNRAGSIDYGNK